jgi:hypothetical protein
MDSFFWFAIVILFILIFAISAYVRNERTKAVKRIAAQLDWEFCGHGKENLPTLAWNFDLFSKGRARQVRNLLRTQQEDASIFIFDYQYTTGGGKNSRTYYQTVVLFASDTLTLPRFFLIPENFLHKIGNIFGYHDIDFSDSPQFSEQYLLRGDFESRIRQLFNYRVISFYEEKLGRRRVSTEGINTLLAYYYAEWSQPPETWPAFLQEALTAYRLFKA